MRILIRSFFRLLRLILTPFVLVSEKLSTPKPIVRTAEQQAQIDTATQGLALYQFRACPFCVKVRKEIARLGLKIELRDALKDPTHRQALLDGGGKTTVPCLLITHTDGQEEWMYESDEIIRWLNQQFA